MGERLDRKLIEANWDGVQRVIDAFRNRVVALVTDPAQARHDATPGGGLDVAEHLGKAGPPVDLLQEIGDAHAWHQSIEPTPISTAPLQHGEQARLAVALGGVALAGGPVILAQGEQCRLPRGRRRLGAAQLRAPDDDYDDEPEGETQN
jgi:hypothetical protein